MPGLFPTPRGDATNPVPTSTVGGDDDDDFGDDVGGADDDARDRRGFREIRDDVFDDGDGDGRIAVACATTRAPRGARGRASTRPRAGARRGIAAAAPVAVPPRVARVASAVADERIIRRSTS